MFRAGAVCTALLIAALAGGPAVANGRFPASRSVHMGGPGDQVAVYPMTFGLLVSSDGGATIDWVCEDAMGYSGTYDPSFAVAADGSIWLTSFDGVRVSRDGGCSFTAVGAPFDALFPGSLVIDASGGLWSTTAQAGASNGVYRNADPGQNVFTRLDLDAPDALLTSVRVGSSGLRAYVGGFAIDDSGGTPVASGVLYRTIDGGANWDALDTDDFTFGSQPETKVMAVSPANDDLVFVLVSRSDGDFLYRSIDGGDNFTQVHSVVGTLEAVHVRADGTVIAASGVEGEWVSTDDGATFSSPMGDPQLACITETAAGVLYGCANNYAPDLFSVGTSTDGTTWTKLFQFDDIRGPLACPEGSVQHDTCEVVVWPGLAMQLGLVPAPDAGPSAGPDAAPGGEPPPPSDGCGCAATPSWPVSMLMLAGLSLGLGLVLGRRRRGQPAGRLD